MNKDTGKEESKESLIAEQRQLLSIFDGIDEPVYISDPETFEVLFANKAIKKVFGVVVGKKCYQSFQGLKSPCSFCTNEYIFGENIGKTHVWEFKNNLNSRWYRCIDKAIWWPDGRWVRYEMALDITDKKEAEEKIKQQYIYLRSVLESITHPFYIINVEDYMIKIANSATGIYGVPGEVSGNEEKSNASLMKFENRFIKDKKITCYKLTHHREKPCDGERDPCPVIEVKRSKKPVRVEHTHFDKNGKEIFVEVHGYPILDEKGNVREVIEYSIDITERKMALEQLALNLMAFDRSADRLRNPLAVIMSSLELKDVIGIDEVLKAVNEQAKRIKEELDNLRKEEVETFKLLEKENKIKKLLKK